MVLGLGKGKNNSGEAKIVHRRPGWMGREGEHGLCYWESRGPNCPALFCTGFRSDEKWICVNIRQVRRGYYSREPVWGEPLLGSGQGKEVILSREKKKNSIKNYLHWKDPGYLFILHCFLFECKYGEILLIIILVSEHHQEICRVLIFHFFFTFGKIARKQGVGLGELYPISFIMGFKTATDTC